MSGADAARWAPELGLAAASLAGAALAVTRRRRGVAWEAAPAWLAAGALLLLALDAGLGAAEYAGLGAEAAAAHGLFTDLFRTAGLAAALAAALACAARTRRTRRAATVAGGALALAASLLIPLAPVLAAAHALGAVARAPGRARAAAAIAATALLAVVVGQLRMAEGTARLAELHLGLGVWALASSAQVRARAPATA